MARKKQTANQKAFQKQRQRLLQTIRRAEKQGYIFDENLVPSIPKRVTKKALEGLKATKSADLYKKSRFLDVETGELTDAQEHRKQVRKEAYKKGRRKKTIEPLDIKSQRQYPTIDVLERLRERLVDLQREVYPPIPIEVRKNELLSIFDDTVMIHEMNDNLEEYVTYIKNVQYEIFTLMEIIAYGSQTEIIEASFARIARLLNKKALSQGQAERISQMSELNYE